MYSVVTEVKVNTMYDTIREQRGFSLTEVLVSIVVFSVGLIGIAKLQVVSKQSNYDAVQRVTATTITEDLLQRMRSNGTQLLGYVTISGSNTLGGGTINAEPTPDCSADTVADRCDAAQLASHDLWQIEQALDGARGLVSPTLCLSGPNDGSSGVYTVAIAWRGTTATKNPSANSCGEGLDKYGTNEEYRRLLVLQTYIDNQ